MTEINENKTPRVYHFTEEFTLSEITEYMKEDVNALYFTRTINNELHVVKHNPSGVLNISELESQLLKFYESSTELLESIKDAKVKGNSNFGIIHNVNESIIEKLKQDLTKLLVK